MKEQIAELRKMLPIPISEAVLLLKNNNSDIERCANIFKARSIEQIEELTGCESQMAEKYYKEEDFDFNRTVSTIREIIYDQNYISIDGLTRENISFVFQWLGIIENDDFILALDFYQLNVVLETLRLIPNLNDISVFVQKAKEAKDIVFNGYSDSNSLEEYVRRHKCLDDNEDFQYASTMIVLKLTIIREELTRHARNLQPEAH